MKDFLLYHAYNSLFHRTQKEKFSPHHTYWHRCRSNFIYPTSCSYYFLILDHIHNQTRLSYISRSFTYNHEKLKCKYTLLISNLSFLYIIYIRKWQNPTMACWHLTTITVLRDKKQKQKKKTSSWQEDCKVTFY